MNILITGGAGFIGQHTAKKLLNNNHNVFILDNLSEQIHGKDIEILKKNLYGKLICGDVRDKLKLEEAFLNNIEVIYHFAAETGTGQSMYSISEYSDVNIQGTAILLNYIQDNKISNSVKKIIVASSRAIYGEGEYKCQIHGSIFPFARNDKDMLNGEFENKCPICHSILELCQTSEEAPFQPTSIYGLTKQVQEQMVLLFARNSDIQAYALRYQNVYGPGQSLLNPYTGILAVFSNLARIKQDINIFEDGLESRDFIYIDDVVEANILCLKDKSSFVGALNIGTGVSISVTEVAKSINNFFGNSSNLIISGMFRAGDIRHNKAEIIKASNQINFKSQISFKDGIKFFLEWATSQEIPLDYGFNKSLRELSEKGLIKK